VISSTTSAIALAGQSAIPARRCPTPPRVTAPAERAFYQRLTGAPLDGNGSQETLQRSSCNPSSEKRTKAQVFFENATGNAPWALVSSINIMDSTPKSAG
jgi:hypothetical protein